MRLWKKITADTRATEVAEAALVLPLTFMLLLGIYWFGRAYNIYATITHAAHEGARAAVVNTCATCATPDAPLTPDQVAHAVGQVLLASKLDPNQVSSVPPSYCQCGDVSCSLGQVRCATGISGAEPHVCIQYNAQLTDSPTGAACGVAVSFQYPYQFYFPFTSLNLQQINLKAQSQMQGEE
jgi:Flp pilus assembly protein TadG